MLQIVLVGIFFVQGLFGTLAAIEPEKANIAKRLQDLNRALVEGNKDQIARFWSEDAEFERPVNGELIRGKEEIAKFFQERSREFKDRGLAFDFKPLQISILEPNHATVQGIAEIRQKQGLFLRTARQIDLVKQKDEWVVKSVKEIEVAPPPPLYDHLKELGWLEGKWKDKDEDVEITFVNNWDQFRNFLRSHFIMANYGIVAMDGIQIIGWDPKEQKIRSWVFDSDGGTGTGYWTKNGDAWHVTLNYLLGDGKKGSATLIYKKIDDNSYSFASTDRSIDGEALPDVEPVTVVKEK